MKEDAKITTLNFGDKKGVSIVKSKYEQMREAILSNILDKKEITLRELNSQVEKELSGKFDGKIGWYLMAVKLDLEVRGEIERVQGKVPQTLKKA